MKKMILMFVVIFMLVVSIQAEKIGVLNDVLKPETMAFKGDRIYVVEKAGFFEYSLKDLKLLNRFGKKGEGPGELSVTPGINNTIVPLVDRLFVEGFRKVMLLSNKGELIKETRKKTQIFKTLPLGDNFAALRMKAANKEKKIYLALSLFDNKMDMLKDIFEVYFVDGDKDILMAPDAIHFAVYKGRLYVENSAKGFVIDVYDNQGNLLYTIDKKILPLKYTKQHFEAGIQQLKDDDLIQMIIKSTGGWESFEKQTTFVSPDYLPTIQDITVQDDKIYILTYETEGEKEKHIIMDLKGKILQSLFLPMSKKTSYVNRSLGRDNRFYGYCGNNYYYLLENEDNEEWELHIAAIK
jgi:hypothetical protein